METNEKQEEKYINECGVCPKCGKEELEYGTIELEGDMCYFPYKCNNCGLKGEEWYSMQFTGHNFYDKDNNLITLE